MRDMGITAEQAQAAKRLVNDAGAFGPLIALAARLPADVLAALREAHEDKTVGLCCNAHCEGLNCCVDILLDDPARYAPARVAEAEDVLRRWQQQRASRLG